MATISTDVHRLMPWRSLLVSMGRTWGEAMTLAAMASMVGMLAPSPRRRATAWNISGRVKVASATQRSLVRGFLIHSSAVTIQSCA